MADPIPNYHCPVCGTLSEMILSEEQAFCTNRETCNVISFNPSLPDGGLSHPQYIDWKDTAKKLLLHNKYRRDGTPYPQNEEGLYELARDLNNYEKKIVRQDRLENGYFVSTVWLGMDHSWGEGPPLIFETIVFPPGTRQDEFCERYSTENDAILGHLRAVEHFKSK